MASSYKIFEAIQTTRRTLRDVPHMKVDDYFAACVEDEEVRAAVAHWQGRTVHELLMNAASSLPPFDGDRSHFETLLLAQRPGGNVIAVLLEVYLYAMDHVPEETQAAAEEHPNMHTLPPTCRF